MHQQPTPSHATAQPVHPAPASPPPPGGGVVVHARVIDIDMPIVSMLVFMLKWALASIPAFIILFILGVVFTSCAGLTMGGLLAA